MRGVVSLPHGYGHQREGVRLSRASQVPGPSINDLTDPGVLDEVSGNAVLNGVPVTVAAVRVTSGQASEAADVVAGVAHDAAPDGSAVAGS
jgi:hypothetical protein